MADDSKRFLLFPNRECPTRVITQCSKSSALHTSNLRKWEATVWGLALATRPRHRVRPFVWEPKGTAATGQERALAPILTGPWLLPDWFCPGLVDRLELTSGTLFESRWEL